MGYLGNRPAESYASFEKQVFTIVNSQTAYTLDHSVVNENDIRLVVNNVVQEPGSGKAYTASGTSLTLSAALVNGTDTMYAVFLGRALQTINPPAASVGTSQLAATSVTAAKLNNDIISGTTALASEPSDTDEFLVSDSGTLKRIDYSLIKSSGGLAGMDMWRQTADTSSNAQPITANWERVDTNNFAGIGTAFSAPSSGVWTFPSTGIWEVEFEVHLTNTGGDTVANSAIQITVNNGGAWAIACYAQAGDTGDFKANFAARVIVDVTDTANVKFKLDIDNLNGSTMKGNTSNNQTYVIMKKLGET